jgi:chromosomal replication initiator protein
VLDNDDEPRRDTARDEGARHYVQVRKEILSEFGIDFFRSYVDRLRWVGEINGAVVLAADTAFAQEQLQQRALHRIEARLRVYMPSIAGVEILVERDVPPHLSAPGAPREPAAPGSAAASHPLSYTFDTFCVDNGNFRAHTVAQMIASGAGVAFPLTVIYGPAGCGKTHLLNAIKHHIDNEGGARTALLMWSQEFLEQFQSALHKRRDPDGFKGMVRQPSVLLIDDIQRIFGKKATEEEALSTLTLAAQQGRQVVLTADADADGMSGLDEKLRRVLKGATACEIREPDFDLRRRILEQRVAHYARLFPGFRVEPGALAMIAEKLPVSGRELDGAVGQLVVEAKGTGGLVVTMEAAETALQGKLASLSEKRVTIQMVQKVVATHFGMTVEELLARTRQQSVARPRQIAMYLALKFARRSLPFTGKKFGGFDHTTVMFARDKFAKLHEEDVAVRAEIDEISRKIRRETQD